MQRWRDRRPPLAREDGIHLTEAGYRMLGEELVRALVEALSEPHGG
jgi:lysophospholipase L1-like esterase